MAVTTEGQNLPYASSRLPTQHRAPSGRVPLLQRRVGEDGGPLLVQPYWINYPRSARLRGSRMMSRLLLLLHVLGSLSTTSATSTYSITSYYAGAAHHGTPYFVNVRESSRCVSELPSLEGNRVVSIECTSNYFDSVRDQFGNSPYVLVLQFGNTQCTSFSSAFGIPASDKCVGTGNLPRTNASIGKLNADGSASIRWFSEGSCSEDSQTKTEVADPEALKTHLCVNSRRWYSGKVARRLASSDGSGNSPDAGDTSTTAPVGNAGTNSTGGNNTGSSSTDSNNSGDCIDCSTGSSTGHSTSSPSTTGNGVTTPASTTNSPTTSSTRTNSSSSTTPSTTSTPTSTTASSTNTNNSKNQVTSSPSHTSTSSSSGSTSPITTATPTTNVTNSSGSTVGNDSSLSPASDSSGGTNNNTSTSSESGSGVSIGVIVGIACGCIAVVLAICGLLFVVYQRHNQGKPADDSYLRPTTTAASGDLTMTQGMVRGQTGLWSDDIITAKRISRNKVQVRDLISQGGYGEVYAGVFHGRSVAVKMLLPATRTDIKQVNNFLAEAKMAATMDHPRIVSLVGIAWDSLSDLCVVFEFMEGGDLRSLLDKYQQNHHPVGLDHQKATIAIHVCHALTYLHSLLPSIIHRDLKSRNVLLNRELEAKLTDFGVSRERLDGTMTAGVGTSLWMAPEVMMGERYDDKADIFSLGVLLSELDMHSLPYAREKQTMSDAILLHRIVSGTVRVSFSPYSPREFQDLGYACVSVNPRDRPTAAEALYRMQLILSNNTLYDNGHSNGRSHLECSGSSDSGSYTI